MANYTYSAYGLNFASEFPLPELMPHENGKADIRIIFGKVPEKLESPAAHGVCWQSESGKLLMSIDEVARYLVLEDKEVIIERNNESTEEDIRAFLLGSVLAAVLYSKQIPVIHASVINTPKGAVLFMGRSGAGKSTLLAAFLQRGYGMLADDKAGIMLDEKRVAKVLPAFPIARIMERTIKALDFPTDGSWISRGMGKYVVPIKKFVQTPTKIHAAYSINSHNKDEMSLEPVEAFDKFQILNRNTYRRRFMNQSHQKKSHLRVISKVAEQVKVVKVLRTNNPELINELADKIEEDFTN